MKAVLILKAINMPIGFADFASSLSELGVRREGGRFITYPVEGDLMEVYTKIVAMYGNDYTVILTLNRELERNEIIINDKNMYDLIME